MVRCFHTRSLQVLWGPETHRFYILVPTLQMRCRDLSICWWPHAPLEVIEENVVSSTHKEIRGCVLFHCNTLKYGIGGYSMDYSVYIRLRLYHFALILLWSSTVYPKMYVFDSRFIVCFVVVRYGMILLISFRERVASYDDVIKWKHFPRYWPFVRGIHRSPLNYPHKVQWRGVLMFSLICARINGWVNSGKGGDSRRHRAHFEFIVMTWTGAIMQLCQYHRSNTDGCG